MDKLPISVISTFKKQIAMKKTLILKEYEITRFPGNNCRTVEVGPCILCISDCIMLTITCRASFMYFVSGWVVLSLTTCSKLLVKGPSKSVNALH